MFIRIPVQSYEKNRHPCVCSKNIHTFGKNWFKKDCLWWRKAGVVILTNGLISTHWDFRHIQDLVLWEFRRISATNLWEFRHFYFFSFGNWDFIATENVIYQKLLNDKLKADVGYVYENVVSQILTATGNKLYYHTWPTPSGKHNYEIDFLLSRKAKICPIEVKSSTSNLHVSIDEFQKKYSARILERYILHSKDIRKEQDLILLPMYMSMFL